jgi:hypothetical protein
MRNVNSEGKFVIPAFPQERDLAELLVFLIEGNPEIKLEVARNHGVLYRSFDEFVTTCIAASVSFSECPVECFGAWLIEVARKPAKLVKHDGGPRKSTRRITFLCCKAAKLAGFDQCHGSFAAAANVLEV